MVQLYVTFTVAQKVVNQSPLKVKTEVLKNVISKEVPFLWGTYEGTFVAIPVGNIMLIETKEGIAF